MSQSEQNQANKAIQHAHTLALYGPQNDSAAERAPAPSSLLSASNDIEAVRAWLGQYIDSPNTFNSYRKEAERLLLWLQYQGYESLQQLKQEDFLHYRYFLVQPEPANLWIMPRGARHPRTHPQWRPFSGPLAASSIHQALTILNSLMGWLQQAGYLENNPLALIRNPSPASSADHSRRYFPRQIWQEILRTIQTLPRESARQQAHYHRYRWLFSLLYGTGLRVSELCAHHMGDFYQRFDGHGHTQWWLSIEGKGKRQRNIPITTELMAECQSYRSSLGLAPTPQPYENTPLLLPLFFQATATDSTKTRSASTNQVLQPLSRATVHRLVKNICQKTAQRLKKQSADTDKGQRSEYEHAIQLLEQASPHWLRHTAGTHMVENDVALLHVRDTLGHSSLTTTNRYLHTADKARHEHTEKRHQIGWPLDK